VLDLYCFTTHFNKFALNSIINEIGIVPSCPPVGKVIISVDIVITSLKTTIKLFNFITYRVYRPVHTAMYEYVLNLYRFYDMQDCHVLGHLIRL
jgi:hypothetical protein